MGKQKLAEEEKAQNEASNTGGRKSKKNDENIIQIQTKIQMVRKKKGNLRF